MPEQLETEFTFEPAVGADLPDLDEIPDVVAVTKPRVFRLEAVYFDTEDFRLMRAGVTLRRRTGGEDAAWHVKLPAPRHKRLADFRVAVLPPIPSASVTTATNTNPGFLTSVRVA